MGKTALVKMLRDNGVKISRETQKDYEKLKSLCVENGLMPTIQPYVEEEDVEEEGTGEPTTKPEPVPEPITEPDPEPVTEPEPEPTPDKNPEPVEEPKVEPETETEEVPEVNDHFKMMQDKIKEFEKSNPVSKDVNYEEGGTPLFETKEPGDKTKRKPSRKRSKKNESEIEGYILLTVMDMLIPSGFILVNNMFTKKKIKFGSLSLSEKQFQKLEPLADRAAESLQINSNPLTTFFIVGTVMYAGNFMALKQQQG